jgi:hypothetical protein
MFKDGGQNSDDAAFGNFHETFGFT